MGEERSKSPVLLYLYASRLTLIQVSQGGAERAVISFFVQVADHGAHC